MDNCKTVFVVEIKSEDNTWGATPRVFSTEEEAKAEAVRLRLKYPFISECRIILRRTDEERK